MSGNEGKAREARGVENRVASSPSDTDREGAASGRSQRTRHINVGNVGTDSQGSTVGNAITGGIIGQLISDTEDRITEAQECIDWYRRELEKNELRLANLRQLEELAKQTEQG